MNTQTTLHLRGRGSVMIMVVVVLVLLAMLGAAYLQVARVQRVADVKPVKNIDTIMQSIIAEIKLQLLRDIVDADGKFFDESGTTGGIEPYDYPSRNTDPTAVYDVKQLDGTVFATKARGNHLDDTWLSSTTPDFTTNEWPKITNLTGAVYPASGATPYSRDVADGLTDGDADIITADGFDTNVDINSAHLVDADGDTIGDSRWERAPIPLQTGTEYFMAVRIVDLSSLLNLRTATIATTNALNAGYNTLEVAGFFPSSVDLSRLMRRKTGQANVKNNLGNMFADPTLSMGRSLSTYATSMQFPLGLTDIGAYTTDFYGVGSGYEEGQVWAWRRGGRLYGQLAYAAEPTLELHYRGGLNDPNRTTAYETVLGDDATSKLLHEGNDPSLEEIFPSNAAKQAHFVGNNTTNYESNSIANVRHMVTTVSGHKPFAPNPGNMHLGNHVLKIDLNTGESGSTGTAQDRFEAIRTRLETIFAMTPGYSGMSGSPQAAAAEFAASIVEYTDPDSELSVEYDIGGTKYYGMETLPYLAEGYLQMGYQGSPPPQAPGAAVEWTPVPDSEGVVVEIRNPFDRPIHIGKTEDPKGPRVRVAIFELGNSTPIAAVELPSITLIPRAANGSYPSTAKRVYVSNGSGTPGATEGVYKDNDVQTALGLDASITDLLTERLTFTTDQQIVIALQTLRPGLTGAADEDWVTYDRLTDASLIFPGSVPFHLGTPPATKTQAFIQKSIKRDGRKIHFMSNAGKAVASRGPNGTPPNGFTAANYQPNLHTFGTDNKLGLALNALPAQLQALSDVQFPIANRAILSLGEMAYISMLGFNSSETDDLPQRLDDPASVGKHKSYWTMMFGTPVGAEPLATRTIATDAGLGYNYLILDQFTVLHPGWDGVDNNDDDSDANPLTGADDSDERTNPFIAGTLNINTAPKHLLAYGLPVPLIAIGTDDATTNRMQWLAQQLVSNRPYSSLGKVADHFYGATTPAQTWWDVYPSAEETLPSPQGHDAIQYVTYNVAGTPEYNNRIFHFLPQVLSTRSDIFMAHILVKGYTSGDLGAGKAVEVGRKIVIFSRAKVASANDEVEVIGVYDY